MNKTLLIEVIFIYFLVVFGIEFLHNLVRSLVSHESIDDIWRKSF